MHDCSCFRMCVCAVVHERFEALDVPGKHTHVQCVHISIIDVKIPDMNSTNTTARLTTVVARKAPPPNLENRTAHNSARLPIPTETKKKKRSNRFRHYPTHTNAQKKNINTHPYNANKCRLGRWASGFAFVSVSRNYTLLVFGCFGVGDNGSTTRADDDDDDGPFNRSTNNRKKCTKMAQHETVMRRTLITNASFPYEWCVSIQNAAEYENAQQGHRIKTNSAYRSNTNSRILLHRNDSWPWPIPVVVSQKRLVVRQCVKLVHRVAFSVWQLCEASPSKC